MKRPKARARRKDHLKPELALFRPLFEFVNQPLTPENWQSRLLSLMGEEKSCHVAYQTPGEARREKMLECDIAANLQVELFGTSVVFDEAETQARIAQAIIEIEDCLPGIGGKNPGLDPVRELRNELRGLLGEISQSDLSRAEEQVRLRKKIDKAFGAKGIQRDAVMFPDGDVFFKSWLYEKDDARSLAFFQLARLLDRLCRPLYREMPIPARPGARAISLKLKNGILAAKIHRPGPEDELAIPLKLAKCSCGCDMFFLHNSNQPKNFLNTKHRMKFHNTNRTISGENREAVRKHRRKKKRR